MDEFKPARVDSSPVDWDEPAMVVARLERKSTHAIEMPT